MLIFGIIWWALIVDLAVLAGLFWLVWEEWPGRSLGWALVAGGAALWLSGVDVPGLVLNDPLGVLWAVVIYVLVGMVWSGLHWLLWVNSEATRELILERHESYESRYRVHEREGLGGSAEESARLAAIPPFEKSNYYPFGWGQDFPRILTWVIWWPIDLILYVLGDFAINVATMVGHWFSGIYAGIARGVVNRVIQRR